MWQTFLRSVMDVIDGAFASLLLLATNFFQQVMQFFG